MFLQFSLFMSFTFSPLGTSGLPYTPPLKFLLTRWETPELMSALTMSQVRRAAFQTAQKQKNVPTFIINNSADSLLNQTSCLRCVWVLNAARSRLQVNIRLVCPFSSASCRIAPLLKTLRWFHILLVTDWPQAAPPPPLADCRSRCPPWCLIGQKNKNRWVLLMFHSEPSERTHGV